MAFALGSLLLVFAKKAHSEPTNEYNNEEIQYYLQGNPSAYYSWELTQRATKLVGSRQGVCTMAVRKFLGVGANEIQGVAKNNRSNSQIPEVGAVIITSESSWGHVGIVLSFTETDVTIYESNVPLGSEIAGIRTLKLNDPRIVGYKIIQQRW